MKTHYVRSLESYRNLVADQRDELQKIHDNSRSESVRQDAFLQIQANNAHIHQLNLQLRRAT